MLAAVAAPALAFPSGGYAATTWAWATVAALVVAGGAMLAGRRPAPAGMAMLAPLAGFALWIAFEATRAGGATHAVPELERTVLYVAGVWAALVVLRRSDVVPALAGTLVGIVAVCCAALGSFLLPHHVLADAYEGRLLYEPLGYANACGILAAVGVVLALGFAAHAERAPARVIAGASLVPLVSTVALAQSRGAAVAALAGLGVGVALDPRRRALAATAVVLAPLPFAGALLGMRSHLNDPLAASELVARDGRLVAAALVLLVLGQAAVASRHNRLAGSRVPLFVLAAVAACAVVLGAGALSGDRALYWRVAWEDVRSHPLLGSGPGSFGWVWLEQRTQPVSVLNAHNLYLEELAETGPLGLLLLVAALAAPLVAAARRRTAVTALAAAAYATFLAHAAVDWDWQFPAVTIPALVFGASVLADARPCTGRPRVALVAVALGVAIACAAGVAESKLAAARVAVQTRSPDAPRLARQAMRWQPWSAEPHRLLGESYLVSRERRRARAELVRAAALDPHDRRAWYELAYLGDRAAVARLVRLDPLTVSVRRKGHSN